MNKLNVIFLFMAITSSLAAKRFPDTFRFGVAGASYQIEGGWNEDGKGLSIWDVFTHTLGKIKNNDTGDVACDSYHKYKEDVQILGELGVKLYRLSISWPRILPQGDSSQINQAGIDYYVDLLKELKSKGIEPVVTIHHWDLPLHLMNLGGWLNAEIADYFGHFARIVFKNFGPYVKYWLTLNEPITTCTMGYYRGQFPPEKKDFGTGVYQCAYVHLLAHAKAYRIYDEEFRASQGGKVAINIASPMFYPKYNTSRDRIATERMFEFTMGLYVNPIYKGNWPQLIIDRVGNRSQMEGLNVSRLPELTQEDINLINGTYDFFAVNCYTSNLIQYLPDIEIGIPMYSLDEGVLSSSDPSWNTSSTSWLRSDPPGVRHMLNYIKDKYNPPEIIITENGWADFGDIDDQGRISYLKRYLSNILDAIVDDGVNVTGYTLWSLLDNFEWLDGYSQKFGIIHVDFEHPNRTRTWKSSAKWYRTLIASREIVD